MVGRAFNQDVFSLGILSGAVHGNFQIAVGQNKGNLFRIKKIDAVITRVFYDHRFLKSAVGFKRNFLFGAFLPVLKQFLNSNFSGRRIFNRAENHNFPRPFSDFACGTCPAKGENDKYRYGFSFFKIHYGWFLNHFMASSLETIVSLAALGSAFPFRRFMASPINMPTMAFFPFLYSSTFNGNSRIMSSITDSSPLILFSCAMFSFSANAAALPLYSLKAGNRCWAAMPKFIFPLSINSVISANAAGAIFNCSMSRRISFMRFFIGPINQL